MNVKWNKLVAGLLVFAMVLSLLPGMGLQVRADDDQELTPPALGEPEPEEHSCTFDWANAQWSWTEDNTASLCARCTCEETSTLPAAVEYTVTAQPTCTEAGSASYTASVMPEGAAEARTDVKTVVLAALGHSYAEGICTVCSAAEPAEEPAEEEEEIVECQHMDEDEDLVCDLCQADLREFYGVDLHDADLGDGDFLTFTAQEDNSSVTFSWANDAAVEYYQPSTGWQSYAKGTTITLNTGDYVAFRGEGGTGTYDNVHTVSGVGVVTDDSNHFSMTGKIAASGSVTSLTDNVGLNAGVTLPWNCYVSMFSGCAALTAAPALPATTASHGCYARMFKGCTSLAAAPALPAANAPGYCYMAMFSGCTALTNAPALNALTLEERCYRDMFAYCEALVDAPALPAETLAYESYCWMFAYCTNLKNAPNTIGKVGGIAADRSCFQMFLGCTQLTSAPTLPATKLNSSCYQGMFQNCSSLTDAPELPAGNHIPDGGGYLGSGCYDKMFKGSGIKNAPSVLPSKTVPSSAYNEMFSGCQQLENAPVIEAETVGSTACWRMFYSCRSLETAPDLPAQTVAYNCYGEMFAQCHALKNVPEILPAENLAPGCYAGMFYRCLSLTKAPELPAKNLSTSCYSSMFMNCSALTQAPTALPAETLKSDCYSQMFYQCYSLTKAPALPETQTVASGCCRAMFRDCIKLTDVPSRLPALKMETQCYNEMFSGCRALTNAPELPAMELANQCYSSMFADCSALTIMPGLPAETLANGCYAYMFKNCGSLTDLPIFGITEMTTNSCTGMFYECFKLKNVGKLPLTSFVNGDTSGMVNLFSSSNGLDQMTLKNLDLPEGVKLPNNWLPGGTNGTLYLRPEVYEREDVRTAYSVPSSWSLKPLTLGTDDDWHYWEEAWQHDETHHWHQCEIRTCELTAAGDHAHMGGYEEHTYNAPGAWRWVRESSQDWTAYYVPVCECGALGEQTSADVTKDESSRAFVVYTASFTTEGGTTFTAERTEEIDYTVTYKHLSNKFKYGASAVVSDNDYDTVTKFNWYDVTGGGKQLMATSNKYCFAVTKDTALMSEKAVEAKPVLNITLGDRVNTDSTGKQSLKITAQWSIPSELGCTFVSAGIVRAYSVAPATISDTSLLTTKNPTKLTTLNGTYSATISMSAATALKTVNAAAYLTYKDSNGVQRTMYSPIAYSYH